jgi:dTDP-4-amino-4,6-dideoxygalactose transaminase
MEKPLTIKFVDLGRQYREIQDEVRAAIDDVLETGAFIMGPQLRRFEADFAAYSGAKYCVGVGSGTAALELALHALELQPGDEVIVPANTYIATAIAVSSAGGTPVLVDVDERTSNIDPALIEAALGPRTVGILPVHLYGRPAAIGEILAIAEKHGLFVLEDACQAHGARALGKRVGTFGKAAAFSFYPGKNLGAYGDGGAITTDDAALYERLLQLRDFGQTRKYHHERKGTNSRLDTVQAAILGVKLQRLDAWNDRRRAAAKTYAHLFAGTDVVTPSLAAGEDSVWHLYVVRVPDRAHVMEALAAADIQSGIHYPIPIHQQGAYAELRGLQGSLPVTERLAPQILSLPMFPEITDDELERVARTVIEAVRVSAPA